MDAVDCLDRYVYGNENEDVRWARARDGRIITVNNGCTLYSVTYGLLLVGVLGHLVVQCTGWHVAVLQS